MINLSCEQNKKIGIFGIARTGEAAYEALHNIADVICWDDSEQNRTNFVIKYTSNHLVPITNSAWTKLDYVILSPGIPTTFPAPHEIVQLATEHNIPIISDIDLLYTARPDAHYISITGTNGKSTTTALIHHLLQEHNYDIGGNIGTASLGLKHKANGYVLELSSFQLDITHKLVSNIGIILNITRDHIDRHGTFEQYILSKKSLIDRLSKGGTAILNIDNKITREIYQDLHDEMKDIRFIRTSTKRIIDNGICVKGGKIFDSFSGTLKEYAMPHNKSLQGIHNFENVAAAYAAARTLKLKPEYIIERLATFVGLSHRMQFIGTKGNIDFYNDSKATNAEAASKSIRSLKNIYWLAGGVAKEGGIEDILPLLPNHIKKAYLFGDAKNLFAEQIGSSTELQICDNIEEAFESALRDASRDKGHANILLAPACASYDQFKNYEERGERFIEMCKLI
jgi:UDP-N-acetylmuramoylalanine--D-glutamate ligase